MNVVALIPARGGSKAIPRKNLAPLGGKPLIAWTIEAALVSGEFSRVIVSTDDEEIAAVSREFGAEVPFVRPAEIARDETPAIDVAIHALDWLRERGEEPTHLFLLQPTSPQRTADDIRAAIQLAKDRDPAAIIGVCEANPHPFMARAISDDGHLSDFLPGASKPKRRQDYPAAYFINGAVYLSRTESLRETRSFQPPDTLAFVMPPERSLDIDTPLDLRVVEFLLTHEVR